MLKELLPPITLKYLTKFFYGWSGNYKSWTEAKNKCTGYDDEVIFNKVKSALIKVKKGEAVFERDSVIFDKIHYSYPLLSALSLTALNEKLTLNVLDFGGSLGSAYFQNKNLFPHLVEFNWNIVEQKHFVTEGKKTFSDKHLNFYYNIDECLKEQQINLFLLGSVIQYIEKPYELLDEILKKHIPYICFDRTPIFKTNSDRITIQKVHKSIYKAQYPCWILNETKLINYLCDKGYELVFDAESNENMNLTDAHLKGYYFKLRN
ncbi:MAG: methyltransferase, TIGR04325 family [Flavobacteriales bacterium]